MSFSFCVILFREFSFPCFSLIRVRKSIENSREIIKSVLAADETYAVCLREDNVAIGSIGLIPPAQSHTKAADHEIEIGYWILDIG